jgi:hypothetical protein
MMLATGAGPLTLFVGSTFSVDGATPKEHFIIAPLVTIMGIGLSTSLSPTRKPYTKAPSPA